MKSKWVVGSWVVCVTAAAAGLKINWRQFVLRRVAVKTMSKYLSRNLFMNGFKPAERRAQKLF